MDLEDDDADADGAATKTPVPRLTSVSVGFLVHAIRRSWVRLKLRAIPPQNWCMYDAPLIQQTRYHLRWVKDRVNPRVFHPKLAWLSRNDTSRLRDEYSCGARKRAPKHSLSEPQSKRHKASVDASYVGAVCYYSNAGQESPCTTTMQFVTIEHNPEPRNHENCQELCHLFFVGPNAKCMMRRRVEATEPMQYNACLPSFDKKSTQPQNVPQCSCNCLRRRGKRKRKRACTECVHHRYGNSVWQANRTMQSARDDIASSIWIDLHTDLSDIGDDRLWHRHDFCIFDVAATLLPKGPVLTSTLWLLLVQAAHPLGRHAANVAFKNNQFRFQFGAKASGAKAALSLLYEQFRFPSGDAALGTSTIPPTLTLAELQALCSHHNVPPLLTTTQGKDASRAELLVQQKALETLSAPTVRIARKIFLIYCIYHRRITLFRSTQRECLQPHHAVSIKEFERGFDLLLSSFRGVTKLSSQELAQCVLSCRSYRGAIRIRGIHAIPSRLLLVGDKTKILRWLNHDRMVSGQPLQGQTWKILELFCIELHWRDLCQFSYFWDRWCHASTKPDIGFSPLLELVRIIPERHYYAVYGVPKAPFHLDFYVYLSSKRHPFYQIQERIWISCNHMQEGLTQIKEAQFSSQRVRNKRKRASYNERT